MLPALSTPAQGCSRSRGIAAQAAVERVLTIVWNPCSRSRGIRNAEGPEGLLTGQAPGARPLLSPEQRQALERAIEEGPIPSIHGVVRWRLIDLVQRVWDELRITISPQTMSRELRALNYRKLSARPRHHAKSEAEVDAFKKRSRLVWRRSSQVRVVASP